MSCWSRTRLDTALMFWQCLTRDSCGPFLPMLPIPKARRWSGARVVPSPTYTPTPASDSAIRIRGWQRGTGHGARMRLMRRKDPVLHCSPGKRALCRREKSGSHTHTHRHRPHVFLLPRAAAHVGKARPISSVPREVRCTLAVPRIGGAPSCRCPKDTYSSWAGSCEGELLPERGGHAILELKTIS